MLFNSLEFSLFLPIVFALYWLLNNRNLKAQNALLLIASYVFYGWWDWRFLLLIIFSSMVDYLVGIGLSKTSKRKKRKGLLWISILVNLGLLGVFKYYNFFAQSFADAFTFFGTNIDPTRLHIILPVGISFYTFQTLSYTIDIYRQKLKPTEDSLSFFAYVSFFPQLVAGPIERATNLLPQFHRPRNFDYQNALRGVVQIIWGLFKKIVIADNCAFIVNQIFSDYTQYSGSTLVLGAVLFAFQIYGDFSGYSDIAIGTARLFGFELKTNFSYPYFSRDIAEFWRRWHISLSTWFRDYVYIPLGGSKGGTGRTVINISIIFLVSGFWHGANWTFIFWGFLNAVYFLPLLLIKKNRTHLDLVAKNRLLPNLKECFGMLSTFILVTIGWIFFRAESLTQAFDYVSIICSASLLEKPYAFGIGLEKMVVTGLAVAMMILIEWFGRKKECPIWVTIENHSMRQWVICYVVIILIFLFGAPSQDFIYFQF